MIFSIGASIGMTTVTAQNAGVEVTMRVADTACYSAKKAGGNRVQRM